MTLREYVTRRLIDSLVTLFFILLLNFFLFYRGRPQNVGQLLNLFLTFPQQFPLYLKFVFFEGFGPFYAGTVLDNIMRWLPFSLVLWVFSAALILAVGIPFGVLASFKRGRKVDALLTICLIMPCLVPGWWLAKFTFYSIGDYFHLPVWGWYSDRWLFVDPWSNPAGFAIDVMKHMMIPLIALTLGLTGLYFLFSRNSMLDITTEEYITTAKAKGLGPRSIMFRHALRNALLPITAMVALLPSILLNASVGIEFAASNPGIGIMLKHSLVDAKGEVLSGPSPILQAVFLMLAVSMVVGHFFFDVVHHALDPRLKTDGGGLAKISEKVSVSLGIRRLRNWRIFWRRFRQGKSGLIGLAIVLFFAFLAFSAPFLPVHRPDRFFRTSLPPCFEHLLGTNTDGQDVLSLLVWGTRVTFVEGVGAMVMALTIGCVIGLLSGYFDGRWYAYLLERITDVFLSMPFFVFVLYFRMGTGPLQWLVGIALATWPFTAKMVRSQVILEKEKLHVEAAKALGASNPYIMLHHVLPNAFSAIASSAIYVVTVAITLQSTLDYLGLERNLWSRIDPVTNAPFISWGTMLSYGTTSFEMTRKLWISLPPAIFMILLGIALVAISNRVAYALNPKL